MIRTTEDIGRALAELKRADPRLAAVHALAGDPPLRRGRDGLPGLMATVLAQQVSRASAEAIFARLDALLDLGDARAIADAPPETFRTAGLSRGKERTVHALAEASRAGRLDLEAIAASQSEEAIAALTAVHGVGRWTAQCWLLFCAGHEDVFPAGDLALQVAVARTLHEADRVDERALASAAQAWAPHRSVAARLFWSAYHVLTDRQAEPVPPR